MHESSKLLKWCEMKVCKKENIWLHCDASWGGAFIFSDKLRNQWLTGIERCDSICWNAHKMLGAPFQCSAFITKHVDALTRCNSVPAPYLFQTDKHYSSAYDEAGAKSKKYSFVRAQHWKLLVLIVRPLYLFHSHSMWKKGRRLQTLADVVCDGRGRILRSHREH